jgi:hypothetical protein
MGYIRKNTYTCGCLPFSCRNEIVFNEVGNAHFFSYGYVLDQHVILLSFGEAAGACGFGWSCLDPLRVAWLI